MLDAYQGFGYDQYHTGILMHLSADYVTFYLELRLKLRLDGENIWYMLRLRRICNPPKRYQSGSTAADDQRCHSGKVLS